jgi:hypothetical protein
MRHRLIMNSWRREAAIACRFRRQDGGTKPGAVILPYMAKYYFDCEVDGKTAEDEEGVEFASLAAVEAEAKHSATAIAFDEFPPSGGNGLVVIRVRDEQGHFVLTVRFLITTTVEWNAR